LTIETILTISSERLATTSSAPASMRKKICERAIIAYATFVQRKAI